MTLHTPRGCSAAKLCPCEGPWRSHGQYINCVAEAAAQFLRDGLISATERRNIVLAEKAIRKFVSTATGMGLDRAGAVDSLESLGEQLFTLNPAERIHLRFE